MNKLAQETSPYLLQHRENPVDWYPWGEEALARARREKKPILLSIGYSACHWCHVMAHESFENPAIAKIMNDHFINIKVDREERPDLDQIYQNVAQALTHGGGWPLTVFLTPDLKPFFGGTYFPPEDRYGRPGFPRVLESLSKAFREDAPSVVSNAEKLTAYIDATEALEKGSAQLPSWPQLEKIANLLASRIDFEEGGLGGAPKFPNTMSLSFLWRMGQFGARKIENQVTETTDLFHRAVTLSLTKMACGGIYDQLGGGFHRYSVDDTWSVPHFEKMLYDNGLLLKLYSEVLLSGGPVSEPEKLLYQKTLRETVGYLLREMRSPEGVFYAAQDADSEGEEGKFFAWSLEDLIHEAKLTLEQAKAFAMRFGISEKGNFEHGKTVLYFAQPLESLAEKNPELDAVQARCFEVRSRRVAPGRDDKVLTSWNGLAISGLIWAAAALEKDDPVTSKSAREAALRAYDFIVSKVSKPDGHLYSTYQGGKPKLNAYLDDYAFMAWAALDLARFDSGPRVGEFLRQAKVWIDHVLKHFSDPESPGYFFTSDDHEKLIQRPKTIYDQAIPAGIAVVLECLLAFDELDLGGESARYAAEWKAQLEQIYPQIEKSAFGFGELLCTALLAVKGPVVLSGPEAAFQIRHPHLFQKLSDGQRLVCHRKTCGLPARDEREFGDAVKKALNAV